MDRHHTLNALAGAAVTASLLLPSAAHAAGPGPAPDPAPEPGTRPCFIGPAQWNEALDGPVPRCPATTSASPAPDTASDAAAGDDPRRPWLPIL